ncbi:MAG TPA: Ig-like domain-containing protein, partial [Candidatus Kapabacteria bacterium]|nr:Ig-like domain-containing protein [Candidatus Kapabacteria bacterium]
PVSITSATIGSKTLTADPNTGFNTTYTFTYTTDGTETEGAMDLSIGVIDQAGNTATFTHSNLTGGSLQIIFDKTPPSISSGTITSPNSTTIWATGSHNIEWTTTNITDGGSGLPSNPITLEYFDGSSWNTIASNVSNTSPYSWNVPNINTNAAKIRITAVDNAGNTSSQESDNFIIDNTGPSVVLSNDISNRQEVKQGTVVKIIATFTDVSPISESTAPTITITNGNGSGSDISNATMSKTSNTVWYYDWTVPSGDFTCNVSVSATDVAGNANQTPTGITSYIVDNIQPTVELSNNLLNTNCVRNSDGTLTITATFTETNTINETIPPKITIANGAGNGNDITNVDMTKSTNKVWTYIWNIPNDNLNALVCNISISATDLAGNTNQAATGITSKTVDNVRPSVTLSSTSTTYVNAPFSVTVAFSEQVDGFNVSDIVKTGTATAAISGFTTSDNITWTFTVTPSTEGSIILDIPENIAYDCPGNLNTASNTLTRYYDVSAPSIPTRTIASTGNEVSGTKYAKIGDVITLTLQASKPITQPTVTIGGSSASVSGGAPTTNYTATLTITDTIPASDGEAAISVSSYTDEASNAGPTYTTLSSGSLVVVDRVKPSITASGNVTVGSGATNRFFVDITFNEGVYTNSDGTGALSVSDFDTPIIVTGSDGAVTSATITHVTQPNNSNPAFASPLAAGATQARVFFTTNIAPTGVETISISLKNNEVFDIAGNDAVNQSTPAKTLPDRSAPTISNIAVNSISNGQVWKKQGDNVTITFNIVEVSGIQGNPDVILTDQSSNTYYPAYQSVSGSGTNSDPYLYTYTYTVGSGNTVMNISVSATDNLNFTGNATLTNAFTVDNTAPEVQSISRNPITNGSNYITNDDVVSFTVVFNEPVIGFDNSKVTLNTTGTVNNPSITVTQNTPSNYTVTLGSSSIITGDGSIGITVNNTSITDYALNQLNPTPSGDSPLFTIDNSLPSVTSITASPTMINGSNVGNGTFTITVVFNEDMDSTESPTITFPVENPTSLSYASGTWSNATTYVATYNVANNGLILSNIDIRVAGAKDIAGNVMAQTDAVDKFSINLNTPTLTSVAISSNNANTTYAKVGDEVTITIVGSESLQNVTATINGVAATVAGSGANWTAKVTMTSAMSEGLVSFAINYENTAGNAGSQVTSTTNTSSVTFDKTAPALAITAPSENTRVNGSQALTYTASDTHIGTTRARVSNSSPAGTFTAFASGSLVSTIDGWANVTDGNSFTVELENTDLAGNQT